MANPKKVTLNMLVQEQCSNVHSKIPAERVVVDHTTGELLSARLKQIAERLELAGVPDTDDIARLEAELKKVIGTAPDGYKSLGELYDYINSLDAVVTTLHDGMFTKVDKVEGKGLSTNDFTNYYKAKLDTLTEGGNGAFVEKSSINGNLLVNGEEVTVYEHPTTDGWMHLPSGGQTGQLLAKGANNTHVWVDAVPDSEKKVLSATKLETPRNITFSGAFTSIAQFDGSSDINFVVESVDATKLSGIIPWANLPEISNGSFVQADFLESDENSAAFIKNKEAVIDIVTPAVTSLISKKVEFSGNIIPGAFVTANADGTLSCTTNIPGNGNGGASAGGSTSVVTNITTTVEATEDGQTIIDIPEGVNPAKFSVYHNGKLMVQGWDYSIDGNSIKIKAPAYNGDLFTFIGYADAGSSDGSGTINGGVATGDNLGLVKSSTGVNKIKVAEDGTMSVDKIDMSCLVTDSGITIVLNGGSATD